MIIWLTVAVVFILMIFLYLNKKGVESIVADEELVYKAHHDLGFPDLSRTDQLKILETGDMSPIAALTPGLKDKGVPRRLLERYITISKDEFRQHLRDSDFIQRQRIENAQHPMNDGFWIKEQGGELIIIDQERGVAHRTWNIKNMDEAVDVYTDLLWVKK